MQHSVTCSWSFTRSGSQQHVNTKKEITTFAESGSGHVVSTSRLCGQCTLQASSVLKASTPTRLLQLSWLAAPFSEQQPEREREVIIYARSILRPEGTAMAPTKGAVT